MTLELDHFQRPLRTPMLAGDRPYDTHDPGAGSFSGTLIILNMRSASMTLELDLFFTDEPLTLELDLFQRSDDGETAMMRLCP